MSQLDISGLDKVELLRRLHRGQSVAGFYAGNPSFAPPFNAATAEDAVKDYIDYFCGRCIKTDISGDDVNPRMYDRDAGAGKFAQIVKEMRDGMVSLPEPPREDTGLTLEEVAKTADSKITIETVSFTPSVLSCPDGSGRKFKKFSEMIPGSPAFDLCGNCPMIRSQHV